MGFLEKALQIARDVGAVAVNSINEKANEVRQLKGEYESKSDDELFRIANSDGFLGKSLTEKGVALSTLKSRGYTGDDISLRKS